MQQIGVAHHAHDHCAGVPAACDQAPVHRLPRRRRVDVKRLRIVLRGKGDDFVLPDALCADLFHFTDLEIFPVSGHQRSTLKKNLTAGRKDANEEDTQNLKKADRSGDAKAAAAESPPPPPHSPFFNRPFCVAVPRRNICTSAHRGKIRS
jgi:hypothetical protein